MARRRGVDKQQRRTRTRTKFTERQLTVLHEAYREGAYPDNQRLSELSEELGVAVRVVRVWFQNNRAVNVKAGNIPVRPNRVASHPVEKKAAVPSVAGGKSSRSRRRSDRTNHGSHHTDTAMSDAATGTGGRPDDNSPHSPVDILAMVAESLSASQSSSASPEPQSRPSKGKKSGLKRKGKKKTEEGEGRARSGGVAKAASKNKRRVESGLLPDAAVNRNLSLNTNPTVPEYAYAARVDGGGGGGGGGQPPHLHHPQYQQPLPPYHHHQPQYYQHHYQHHGHPQQQHGQVTQHPLHPSQGVYAGGHGGPDGVSNSDPNNTPAAHYAYLSGGVNSPLPRAYAEAAAAAARVAAASPSAPGTLPNLATFVPPGAPRSSTASHSNSGGGDSSSTSSSGGGRANGAVDTSSNPSPTVADPPQPGSNRKARKQNSSKDAEEAKNAGNGGDGGRTPATPTATATTAATSGTTRDGASGGGTGGGQSSGASPQLVAPKPRAVPSRPPGSFGYAHHGGLPPGYPHPGFPVYSVRGGYVGGATTYSPPWALDGHNPYGYASRSTPSAEPFPLSSPSLSLFTAYAPTPHTASPNTAAAAAAAAAAAVAAASRSSGGGGGGDNSGTAVPQEHTTTSSASGDEANGGSGGRSGTTAVKTESINQTAVQEGSAGGAGGGGGSGRGPGTPAFLPLLGYSPHSSHGAPPPGMLPGSGPHPHPYAHPQHPHPQHPHTQPHPQHPHPQVQHAQHPHPQHVAYAPHAHPPPGYYYAPWAGGGMPPGSGHPAGGLGYPPQQPHYTAAEAYVASGVQPLSTPNPCPTSSSDSPPNSETATVTASG